MAEATAVRIPANELESFIARAIVAVGISKSATQAAIRTLTRRRLISAERPATTAVPVYTVATPWRQ